MTIEELLNALSKLESVFKSDTKSLEEYWRAMYPLAIKHKNDLPTLDLFYTLIKGALENEPKALNSEWLKSTAPPISNLLDHETKLGNSKIESNIDDFDFFIKVLKFQISDLYKMRNKQLMEEDKYFGVDSETSHRWFNFDPLGILECGLAGMSSNGFDIDLENWIFLGEIIEMGRIYE